MCVSQSRVPCPAGENIRVELFKPCACPVRIFFERPLVRASGERKATRLVIEQARDRQGESDRVPRFDGDSSVRREIPHVSNIRPNGRYADNGRLQKRHRPGFVAR